MTTADEATVLFADVVGSTRLGETLDPEHLRGVLSEVIGVVVAAVDAHGGVVQDIAGDGVLAIFDEHDSSQAVCAAAAIVSAIATLGDEQRSLNATEPPTVRVGVHRDRLTRDFLRNRGGYRVHGSAIDGAIALEAAAEPGSALVSDAVLSRCSRAVTVGFERQVLTSGDAYLTARSLMEVPDSTTPGLAELREHRTGTVGAMRDERRTVVAMFAAIVGTNEPFPEGAVVAEALSATTAVVEDFGGHVKDVAGDVVVSVFGAPVAHEDDIDRALRAALLVADQVATTSGGSLAARVGVATGRVIVGAVGAGSHVEYGAVGDAMNTAARLQGKGKPGCVLATEDVRAKSRYPFVWGERQQFEAKGKATPVVASEVRMSGDAADDASVLAPTVLAGRDGDLEAAAAMARDDGFVHVEGDAGIGKSVFVDTVAPTLGHVFAVRLPSWSRLERFGAVHAMLHAFGKPHANLPDVGAAAAAVRAVLRASVETHARVVLVVDDLHFADTASLDVLHEVVAERLHGVVILTTARPDSDSVALLKSGAQVHVLAPLDPAAARELLTSLVGLDALAHDVEARVLATAAGNPLFLKELLRSIDLVRGVDLPDTIERVALARIDAMGPDVRAVIDAGAVLDRDITCAALEVMCGGDVADTLALLVDAHVLEPDTEGRYAFGHPIVRDGMYAALVRRDRERLHRAAVAALPEAKPGTTARHHWRAGDRDEALVYAVRGATAALADGSFEDAAELFEIGAAAADGRPGTDDTPSAWQLLLNAAQARHAAGQLDVALGHAAAAATMAAAARAAEVLSLAAVEYENVFFATRRPRGAAGDRTVELLELARSVGLPAPSSVARVYAALGRAYGFAGNTTRALSLTERALTVGRRCGDNDDHSYALLAWRSAREGPQYLRERLQTSDELLRVATAARDLTLEIEARRLVLMDKLTAGLLSDGFNDLPILIERIERTREHRYAWYVPMWRGMQALAEGRLDAAAGAVAELREVGRRSRYADVAPVHALQTYLLSRSRGTLDGVEPLFRRAAERSGDLWTAFWASYYAAVGNVDAAATHLSKARAKRSLLGGDRVFTTSIALLTDAVEATGDRAAATELHHALQPWQGQYVVVGAGAAVLGPVDDYLGRLAAVSLLEANRD